MRVRAFAVVMVLMFAATSAFAGGFWVGAGADVFLFGDSDVIDAGGFSSTFIGFTPKVGYQINDMWGVNAGYKYFLANEGDGGAEWTQTAIHIAGNFAPFKDGGIKPLYFIAGLDMVTYEFEQEINFGFGTTTVSADDSETGILFGAGYDWMMGDKFSINPEVTYVTGDAGGINIEVGCRYRF
ncbi:porin family protein [bacterium]|nr:porin family protein [bacterium]